MLGLEVSPFAVFLGIALMGFLFLALAMLLGDALGVVGLDVDAGELAPSVLNGRVLGVFATAFGGAGALAIYFGFGVVFASLAGLASGLVFGAVIVAFGRLLYKQQASTDVSNHDLLWKPAQVTVAIPAQGLGQVRVRIGDETVDKVARSRSGEAIGANQTVLIEQVLGGVVVVQLDLAE